MMSAQVARMHAERLLEGEDVLVEPVEGSVDVSGGADDHASFHHARCGRVVQGRGTDQLTKFAAGPPRLVTDQVAEIGSAALSLFAAEDRGGDGPPRSPVCPGPHRSRPPAASVG